ncbi:MAG TPA: glycosyltransferase [Methanofastidiosum sp.]|nr:glycosyltransferase [Methanofastidiosum sp.]
MKKKFNLLITLKLIDRSIEVHMFPIILLESVSKILVVRNTEGPKLNKLDYICPPKIISRIPILNIFAKLFLMLYFGKKNRSTIVIGYYLLPHGILSFITSKLLKIPCCICIIGDIYKHSTFPLFGKMLIRILKKTDYITVTGNKSRNYLISKDIPKEKIHILPNTIDIERFKPIINEKKFDIISLGRLSQEKRLDIFLKIISKLNQSGLVLRVGIVGEGEEKENLVSLSKELGLEKNVEFIGFKKNVEKYYQNSKIFILTSEREGLPLTIVEAMSCGIPVISSNVGDIEDIIDDGKNSFLIDQFDDVDSYVDRIVKLITDEKLYNKFSHEALKIRDRYSVSNAQKVWLSIFEGI